MAYIHTNLNPGPAVIAAMTRGVELSNAAVLAAKRGDHVAAEALHRRALAYKIHGHGAESTQAAISFNGLGEQLLCLGRLEDAETALKAALKAREELALGPPADAAVSRENLGQVYEAMGRLAEAKAVRLRAPVMVCTSYDCPRVTFTRGDLKPCSACTAAFYCSSNCQKADWSKRHKKSCLAHDEGNKTPSTVSVA